MKLINNIVVAFSMYSKIPMPKSNWEKENMDYAIAAFPLIGGVQAALLIGWWHLAQFLQLGSLIFGAVAVAIPLIITGGIHMDGFCDTVDALSSHGNKEDKLRILKDPNAGAFAVIWAGVYLMIYFAFVSQLYNNFSGVLILSCGYILVRAFSGVGVVSLKSAKTSGVLYTFGSSANQLNSKRIFYIYMAMILITISQIHLATGLIAFITVVWIFFWYRKLSYKHFDGITGDLAGYFLQIAELSIIIVVVIVDCIFKVVL